MKKIGIISNNKNLKAISVAKKIYDYLIENKNNVYLLKNDSMPQKYSIPAVSETEFSSKVELLISVGGDGTFLRACRYSFRREVPIMGINAGNLGFLAEINTSNMYDALDNVLNDRYEIEERMLIEGKLYRDNKVADDLGQTYLALNEFVISKPMPGKVVKIKIIVNGIFITSFGADGIIISTPTGSTAYSMSAGGPIVEPKSKVIVITPICAHTIYSRSMVLDSEDTLEVKISSKNESVILNVDGVNTEENIMSGDVFKVRKSNVNLKLITFNKNIFFKIFKEKFLRKN